MSTNVKDSLAEQLYYSSARFVFELLQNAEDNHYTRAREQGYEPYISFQVYDDRIIIDCNEDGFKEENVRAICDVGKSSKVGAQGYIGAKGIGFKSVFMAAWRVHIQSGDFSFYFERLDGDSGIGMIVPLWQDHLPDVPPHITRMTLHLHNTGDQAAYYRNAGQYDNSSTACKEANSYSCEISERSASRSSGMTAQSKTQLCLQSLRQTPDLSQ